MSDVVEMLEKTQENIEERNVPKELRGIRNKFIEAKKNNTPVLIEQGKFRFRHSIVLKIKYIGDKWCMGETTYHRYGKEEKIPYTINYTDLYITDRTASVPKIVFKGDNPFE